MKTEIIAVVNQKGGVGNELTRLGYKDGNGNVKWSCIKISRILRNQTYMGYICYNKSWVNNFLEKKRVKNFDEDTFILKREILSPLFQKSCGINVIESENPESESIGCRLVRSAGEASDFHSICGSKNFAVDAGLAFIAIVGGFFGMELLFMDTSA